MEVTRFFIMTEYRCKKCLRLFFQADFVGTIEIKCPRCNEVNTITEHVIPIDHLSVNPSEGRAERPDRQMATSRI